jgi:hypothetical protein
MVFAAIYPRATSNKVVTHEIVISKITRYKFFSNMQLSKGRPIHVKPRRVGRRPQDHLRRLFACKPWALPDSRVGRERASSAPLDRCRTLPATSLNILLMFVSTARCRLCGNAGDMIRAAFVQEQNSANVVEARRLELLTYCVQSSRSTN